MKYKDAISQATVEAMERDPKVVLLGQNVTAPHGVFGTTTEAFKRFPERCIEIPLSETMITGACVGLAMEGYRPILVHTRADFSLFSFEALINVAAKLPFLRGKPLPFVMRCVVGRGWGQGPVHSQSFHHLLAQVPGLDVVVPSITYYGAYLRWAVARDWPTVIIEPRRLYEEDRLLERVTEEQDWREPDVELVCLGDTILDCVDAREQLAKIGIRAHVIPWEQMRFPPRQDAPRVTVDMAPRRSEPGLVAPPFKPQGVSQVYERAWYPTANDIVRAACELLGRKSPQETTRDRSYAPVSSAF